LYPFSIIGRDERRLRLKTKKSRGKEIHSGLALERKRRGEERGGASLLHFFFIFLFPSKSE
jgi:hypothetical protein